MKSKLKVSCIITNILYSAQTYSRNFIPVLTLGNAIHAYDFTCMVENKDQDFLDFKEAMVEYWKELDSGKMKKECKNLTVF